VEAQLKSSASTLSCWEIAVLIPAQDEEALLGRCLRSTLAAIDYLPNGIRGSVIVVSDSSTDRTTQIAKELLGGRGTVLTVAARSVGTARATGAAHIIQTSRLPLDQVWIANTDADCIIPRRWLTDQIDFAATGVEALAGIVTVDNFEEHDIEVPGRFQASYIIDADGGHLHIHGANLGIRADAYVRAGGWSNLNSAEDHDIWRRLRAAGARTLSSARIHVATSGRRVGRAPHGFAAALAMHNHAAACP
jgi:glycosyltransferase involved in cell wall biosynthesis